MRYVPFAALVLAAAALAAKAPPPPADVPAKVLQSRPDAEFRAKAGVPDGARVVARCKVSETGALSGCGILKENPAGSGAGRVFLDALPGFKVAPATHDGVPVASEIVIAEDWYPLDKQPAWIRKPTERDLLAVFPSEAYKKGVDGTAVINCMLSLQGAVYDCVVLRESPAGMGFGLAATALTPQLLFKPGERGGKPAVSSLSIPFNFKTYGRADPSSDSMAKVVSAVSVWEAAPSFEDIAAAYPKKAREAHIGGRATLACKFTRAGKLYPCSVVTEEPKGRGFGAAALQLAHKFEGKAAPGDDLSKAMVQMPFAFEPAMLDGVPAVGKPAWAKLPTAEQMAQALKSVPAGLGTARVSLDCRVEQKGLVTDCQVRSESPAGQGLGAAALSLTPIFRLSTWSNEGLPIVGGRVTIPLRFETSEAAAAK